MYNCYKPECNVKGPHLHRDGLVDLWKGKSPMRDAEKLKRISLVLKIAFPNLTVETVLNLADQILIALETP